MPPAIRYVTREWISWLWGTFFVQDLVKDGRISNHYVKAEDYLANVNTRHISKLRHCHLITEIVQFTV